MVINKPDGSQKHSERAAHRRLINSPQKKPPKKQKQMEAVPHRRTNDAAFPTLSLAELKPIWAGTTARRTRSGPLKTRGGMVPITRDMNAYSPGSPFGSTRTHAAEHEKWARWRAAARCVWRVQVTKLILPQHHRGAASLFLAGIISQMRGVPARIDSVSGCIDHRALASAP